MRKLIIATAIIALLSAGMAFGAGQAEDTVTAYTTLDEGLARQVFSEFEDETGISVEWVRLSGGEAVSRMEAERENPQASIWFGGVHLNHMDAKSRGLTEPFETDAADHIDDNFRDPDGYWTGIYAGPLAFFNNVNELERHGLEAPTSWEDLTQEGLENRVQMADPGSSGTAYNVLSTVMHLHDFDEDEGWSYMQRLDRSISSYTRSGAAPGQNAALGETTVAIGYAHDGVRLIDEGYPLELTFPEEGTGYEIAAISMVAGGPEDEREAAEALYEFGHSQQAAQLYADYFVAPLRTDVELADGAVPIDQVDTIVQDDQWSQDNQDRLVDEWNERIGEDAEIE